MPIKTRYLFSAAMDVEPAQERLFNEVYDQEHVPSLLTVPGVIAVSRYEMQPLTMSIGGQLKTIVIEGAPKYGARRAQLQCEPADAPHCSAAKMSDLACRSMSGRP